MSLSHWDVVVMWYGSSILFFVTTLSTVLVQSGTRVVVLRVQYR
jgi:hypothetical protein